MKIADLFVGIGVQGDGSAKKALKGVEGGLGEIKSMSLEAKAAIVAAIYALERMMSSAVKTGQSLNDFGKFTGYSTKALQQWQYAAQQVGVSAEDVQGSVKSAQNILTNMLQGHGAPEGLSLIQSSLHAMGESINFEEAAKSAEGMTDMLMKLQKVAQTLPAYLANDKLKSFGFSESMISAMRQGAFRPDVFAKAPIISEGQQKSLVNVGAQMKNIGQKIENTISKLTAKHGADLVKDMGIIVDKTLQLVIALDQLAEKLKVFEVLGATITGIAKAMGFVSVVTGEAAGNTKATKEYLGKDSNASKALDFRDTIDKKVLDFFHDMNNQRAINAGEIAPSVKPSEKGTKEIHHHVPQNIHFNHDGKDHKKTTDSVKKAIKTSYYQNPALAQEA